MINSRKKVVSNLGHYMLLLVDTVYLGKFAPLYTKHESVIKVILKIKIFYNRMIIEYF